MDVVRPAAGPPPLVEDHLLLPERQHGRSLPLPRPPHALPRSISRGGKYGGNRKFKHTKIGTHEKL